MTDHAKRNWQRLAHDRCDQWLLRWRWPEGGTQLLTIDQLRKIMREAYMLGYRDGRGSKKN